MNAAERRRWLQDLLVDDVTQGLSGAQRAELDLLLSEEASAVAEREALLRAASAAELAFASEALSAGESVSSDSRTDDPLPRSLEHSLAEMASRFEKGQLPEGFGEPGQQGSASLSSSSSVLEFPRASEGSGASRRSADSMPVRASIEQPARSSSSVPWWLAAAACVLAAAAWLPRFSTPAPEQVAEQLPVEGETLTAEPTMPTMPTAPSTAPGDYSTVLAMSGTEDETAVGATGQLLWDAERQEGVMLIRGLAPNDSSLSQYQLWIFDAQRDERHPIDGGVFDIADSGTRLADGSYVVPIDARLAVAEPTLFAVTVERPGGVVVSERERIVMVAAVG